MSNYTDILAAFNALTLNSNGANPENGNDNNENTGASSSSTSQPATQVDNIVCHICTDGGNEETLLLCDGCPVAMHSGCLNMGMVPPGEWYCPRCLRNGVDLQTRAPKKGDYVYLYERVSSKGQNNPEYGRVGMDTQNHELMRYCFERNMTVRGTFTDVGSGCDVDNLREFQSMVRRMPRGTCVMIYSVSRFGRNLGQVQQYLNVLHQKDCYVYSVTEGVSSFDQQFLNLVVQAQQESVQLSATMRASVQRRRQEGQWIGLAPYGFEVYRDNQNRRRVRPVPDNHLENRGLAHFTNQHFSERQVLETLQEMGIRPRTGEWSLSRVTNTRRRILQALQNMQL